MTDAFRNSLPATRITSYVAGVVFLSTHVLMLALIRGSELALPESLLWAVLFLVGELLWFYTPTGKGNISMAAVVHMALIPVAPFQLIVPAAWIARLVSNLIIQKQLWYRALFNAAQVSLSVAAAAMVFQVFAGTPESASSFPISRLLPTILLACGAYYVVNVGLVSGVIALTARSNLWSAWRENFGYRVELVSSLALFLLAPVATLAYRELGFYGLLLFFFPVILIRDACQRYIELQRTQAALIGSERLAAKGEMAASVGHEINNYLHIVQTGLQLLHVKGGKLSESDRQKRIDRVLSQAQRMSVLSKGLMDFSHLESRPTLVDLPTLVRETVEFLTPQNRLDGVTVQTDFDPRLIPVHIDPGQLQQVFINLILNAADALIDTDGPKRILVALQWKERPREIEILVEDNGPGISEETHGRVFEPGFTTKTGGHGFGLSTSYRIIHNHGGRIAVEAGEHGGALFRITLPASAARAA